MYFFIDMEKAYDTYFLLLVTSGSSAASSWQPGHHKVSSI